MSKVHETTLLMINACKCPHAPAVRIPSFTFKSEQYANQYEMAYWGSSIYLMKQVQSWIRLRTSAGKTFTALRGSAASPKSASLRCPTPKHLAMRIVSHSGSTRDTPARCNIYRALTKTANWYVRACPLRSRGRDVRLYVVQAITPTSHSQPKHQTHGADGLHAMHGVAELMKEARVARAIITRCC